MYPDFSREVEKECEDSSNGCGPGSSLKRPSSNHINISYIIRNQSLNLVQPAKNLGFPGF
jgi:hypothetical protein